MRSERSNTRVHDLWPRRMLRDDKRSCSGAFEGEQSPTHTPASDLSEFVHLVLRLQCLPDLGIFALHLQTLSAKNNPAMPDDNTTRPMLEALLEGQRQLRSLMAELSAALAAISQRQDEFAANQQEFAAKQQEFAAKQQEFAANQQEFAVKQQEFATNQQEFATNQQEFAAKQQEFAAKQDQLDARLTALIREVRDGFDDCNRKINALNQRLLSFETWLSRIDDRLHDEIIARTR